MRGFAVVLGTGIVALGTIRCYAQAGLRVIHLSTKHDDIAAGSRYVHQRHVVPLPDHEPDKLLSLLTGKLPAWPNALLDPVNDPGVVFCSQHHAELSQHYHVTVPAWDILHGIVDKGLLYERAGKLQVPAPRIRKFASVDALADEAAKFTYPCIIKPTQTPAFFAVYNKKALQANDAASLIRLYRDVAARRLDVMISEIIPGPEENLVSYVCHLDKHGTVLAELCAQKIRQHPADFGYGVVKKTVPIVAEVREASLRLLRDCGYSGFSTTEFKRDARTGIYKLIEINTRQVSYAHLFAKKTINFPAVMYRDKVEHDTTVHAGYANDVYWINPLDDLYEYRSRRKLPGFSARRFFAPYLAPRTVFALNPFDDPRPFLRFAGKTFGAGYSRLLASRAGKPAA